MYVRVGVEVELEVKRFCDVVGVVGIVLLYEWSLFIVMVSGLYVQVLDINNSC